MRPDLSLNYYRIRTSEWQRELRVRQRRPFDPALPFVSVCIPCRNCVETIGETLDAVARQTYSNIEVVVADGASNDGTVEYLLNRSDIDILLSRPDGSGEEAINRALALARGEILCVLPSDDFVNDVFVAEAVRAMQENGADLVYGSLFYVERDGTYCTVTDPVGRWMRYRMPLIPGVSWLARRNVFERVGVFDANVPIASDYDFLLRAEACGVRRAFAPQAHFYHRTGGQSTVDPVRTLRCGRDVAVSHGASWLLASAFCAYGILRFRGRRLAARLLPLPLYRAILVLTTKRRLARLQ